MSAERRRETWQPKRGLGVRAWLAFGIAIAAVVGMGVAVAVSLGDVATAPIVPVTSEQVVAGQAPPAVVAGPAPRAGGTRSVPSGQPVRLRIPAIGMNVAVGAMSVQPGETVDPPSAWSAYWLANYGSVGPASRNTAYIAGHTCRGCTAVFTPLLDTAHNSTTVHVGDAVVVSTPAANYTYSVTATSIYSKASIKRQSELWRRVPGRLVLVTCFQTANGAHSQQNYVVYAQLDR